LTALVALKKVGVFVCLLIKKHSYYTTYFYSNAIDTYFSNKDAGATALVRRVELRAWCINKCDYFCKITGSTL
jgi:hypothetical protein